MENKKEITLDSLALMIANRFDEMDEKMEKGFKEVKTDIEILKTDVAVLKTDVAVLKTDVAGLKVTVDNIEANLNKKVDKVDHNALEYRVERLEKKFA